MLSIPLPQTPQIIEQDGNRAVFQIEGLYPGFGPTLGNAFRRVLFSSIPGAAITFVKIKNVVHEFSTLPGVLEDILEITLNLRRVYLIFHGEGSQTLTLKIKGKKNVTAGDIKTPTQVKIVNPDLHIATLTDKNATLEMEMTAESGLGYETVVQRGKERAPIGTISLDAMFTPVHKVNFTVENMRVGDRTDYNRLRIEIETDGSITPQHAFHRAAQVLVDHFSLFLQLEATQTKKASSRQPKKEAKSGAQGPDILKLGVEDLGLTEQATQLLLEAGIKTVAGLTRKSEEDLQKIDGMGDKKIEDVKKALKKKKVTLRSLK